MFILKIIGAMFFFALAYLVFSFLPEDLAFLVGWLCGIGVMILFINND